MAVGSGGYVNDDTIHATLMTHVNEDTYTLLILYPKLGSNGSIDFQLTRQWSTLKASKIQTKI